MEFGDQASVARIAGAVASYTLPTEFPLQAVVVSQQHDCFVLFIENEKNINDPEAYFLLKVKANCSRVPMVRDLVEILEVKSDLVKFDEEGKRLHPAIAPHREVSKYRLVSEPKVTSHQEIVAIHTIWEEYMTVVGSSFKSQPIPFFFRSKNKDFSPSSFVMVKAVPLSDCILEKIYDPVKRQTQYLYMKDFQGMNKDEEGDMVPLFYPSEPIKLTSEEQKWIFSNLRAKKDVTVDECILYIKYPNVAAYLAEYFRQLDECEKATLRKFVAKIVDLKNGKVELRFMLTEEDADDVAFSNIDYRWRCGVEMSVEHPMLVNGSKRVPAFFNIIKEEVRENEREICVFQHTKDGKYLFVMESTVRSSNLVKIIISDIGGFRKKQFKIHPQPPCSKNVVDAIDVNFRSFVEERFEMFNLYCGRSKAATETEIPKTFLVKGLPLDQHQLDFVHCAAANRGWTVGQAPPGSGKTHSIASVIAKLVEDGETGGICLVAPTNAAATNGADVTEKKFDGIKIIRHFSNRAEYQAGKESRKIGLLHQATNPEGLLEGEDAKKHKEILNAHKTAQKKFEKCQDTREKLQKFGQLTTAEKNVQKNFLKSYKMNVYATTVEVMLREGDVFAYRDKSIKRLILDEAAQLSPVEALALYCLLPELTHICMLGDSYQLGPHSKLKERTMVHKFLTEGELTRMYALDSTHKKILQKVYRCHPEITRQLLKPIYGNKMKVGITKRDRKLAKDKNLLVAADGSPVVFINVKGIESRGHNDREISVLLNLLLDLVKKGINANDLVILCNHRAQMDAVRAKMNYRGYLAADGRPFFVTTVDSFQGKEAKVVILLTTKTGSDKIRPEKMQFVANPQRATVAISRAQHMIYILGDCEALASTDFWSKLLPHPACTGGFLDEELNADLKVRSRCLDKYSQKAKAGAQTIKDEYDASMNRKAQAVKEKAVKLAKEKTKSQKTVKKEETEDVDKENEPMGKEVGEETDQRVEKVQEDPNLEECVCPRLVDIIPEPAALKVLVVDDLIVF